MHKPALLVISLLLAAFLSFTFYTNNEKENVPPTPKPATETPSPNSAIKKRLQKKAVLALSFAQQKNYNSRLCFLIDMSLPSAKKRFYVYDLQNDSVLYSGLVTHGRCNEAWLEKQRYSNVVGSGCTSLGKYRIGTSYYGRFGLAYKLYGLEASNSKAFERYVVLHAHECVPTEEGEDICQSDGCPTVAPGFLRTLAPMIDRSGKPVLLWIFE